MTNVSQKESLSHALEYLEPLCDEFTAEIVSITDDIRRHKEARELLSPKKSQSKENKAFLQQWRRKSFALHRRRTTLKGMKDCLDRQIQDVKLALGRLDRITYRSPSVPMDGFTGLSHPATYA